MEIEGRIIISREFDAPREKVWDCWTNPKEIRKWWGPKDFTAPKVAIDLKVGGKYLYAMHGPKGTPFDKDMYSGGVFKDIVPKHKLVIEDYFTDAKGKLIKPKDAGMDPNFPIKELVTITFEDDGAGKTMLVIEYAKPALNSQLMALKKSGMIDGWNQSLDKLADCLKQD